MYEVKRLQTGDEVHWEDPDNSLTTRYVTVQKIKISGEVISITDINGDNLECFAHELS